jgi:hypothetical protein
MFLAHPRCALQVPAQCGAAGVPDVAGRVRPRAEARRWPLPSLLSRARRHESKPTAFAHAFAATTTARALPIAFALVLALRSQSLAFALLVSRTFAITFETPLAIAVALILALLSESLAFALSTARSQAFALSFALTSASCPFAIALSLATLSPFCRRARPFSKTDRRVVRPLLLHRSAAEGRGGARALLPRRARPRVEQARLAHGHPRVPRHRRAGAPHTLRSPLLLYSLTTCPTPFQLRLARGWRNSTLWDPYGPC